MTRFITDTTRPQCSDHELLNLEERAVKLRRAIGYPSTSDYDEVVVSEYSDIVSHQPNLTGVVDKWDKARFAEPLRIPFPSLLATLPSQQQDRITIGLNGTIEFYGRDMYSVLCDAVERQNSIPSGRTHRPINLYGLKGLISSLYS